MKINNAKFAEMLGVSDKTVTNILTYETHERLDDGVVSQIARILGFSNEMSFIDAYKRGVPDFGAPAIVADNNVSVNLPHTRAFRSIPDGKKRKKAAG